MRVLFVYPEFPTVRTAIGCAVRGEHMRRRTREVVLPRLADALDRIRRRTGPCAAQAGLLAAGREWEWQTVSRWQFCLGPGARERPEECMKWTGPSC